MSARRLAKASLCAAVLAWGRPSFAASSATVSIDLTIAASLSVSVDGAASSTQTLVWSSPNQLLVPPSLATATVRNDSGVMTERWALSTNASAIDTATGAAGWTILSSTWAAMGEDQAAVQAVLGSSHTAAGGCPAAASTDWSQAYAQPLTTALQVYGSGGSALFAAGSGDTPLTNLGTALPDNAGNQRMLAGGQRALCWRVLTPASSTLANTQNIQIIVTAVVP